MSISTGRREAVSRWKTADARAAFLDAWSPGFERPAWFKNIRIEPEPYSDERPIATIDCGAYTARIKVLGCQDAVEGFWRNFPNRSLVVIVVEEIDSAEDIRQTVFTEIERLMK